MSAVRRFRRSNCAFAAMACVALGIIEQSAVAQESPADGSSDANREVTALREEVHALRRDLQLLARSLSPSRTEDAPRGAVPRAIRYEPATSADPDYYSSTYAAADLVVALQKVVEVRLDKNGKVVAGTAEAAPDFSALEELIMARVDPSSWVAAGGDAMIKPFPGNLSLVISHSEENHQRIAELFEALRRGRNPKVVLETRVIAGPRSSFLNRIANLGVPVPSRRKPESLSAHQAKLLLDTAQNDRSANLVEVPALTLAPGQLAQFRLPADKADQVNVLIRADADAAHSQVRLTVVANAQDTVEALRSATSVTLRPDEPLLIDLSQRPGDNTERIHLADRLKSSAAGDNTAARVLLVVTPRIKYDQAALLGIPSTP